MTVCVPIFRQNGQLWFFGPKFTQKWILGSEFQKSKSGFRINTFEVPCVPIFSQNGQLLVFRPKFGEISQLRAIFWFKYCWGRCKELGGGWNELGGGGWSWGKVGARFSNTRHKNTWSRRLFATLRATNASCIRVNPVLGLQISWSGTQRTWR